MLTTLPLEGWLADRWSRIDRPFKIAFLAAACASLLAFGFEMTNLSLHHDDLNHLLVQKPLVGYYLGRFVHAWLFYFVQQGHFTPFLDMTVGMLLMCAYGLLVARFWGAQRAADIALVAAIACVFPYMAHIYQYNSAMVAYPLAHLLAAAAVVVSARATLTSTAIAALISFVALSIYQAVLANAVAIFVVWLLTRVLFVTRNGATSDISTARAAAAALVALILGGILHVVVVKSLNIPFDSAQAADEAFSLRSRLEHGLQLSHAAAEILRGTRAFFIWPEAYFPQPLKALQAILVAGAAGCCLLVPRGVWAKVAALALLAAALLSPRTLQFLHPQGNFHKLTLTAYAVVIAAAVMLLARSSCTLIRNATLAVATVLIAGYIMQCNWISTVNHLNAQAHFATMTQILARLRSLPDGGWDGRTVIVVGGYDMSAQFPFRPATGVANEFLNPRHMTLMARLLRDEARFVKADGTMPAALQFAAVHRPWPSPDSVGVVDGVGVVVLSWTEGDNKAVTSRQ